MWFVWDDPCLVNGDGLAGVLVIPEAFPVLDVKTFNGRKHS